VVAWHYKIVDQSTPGSGKLQWQALGPHAVAAATQMKLKVNRILF
jgi:hypothetical protein